MGKPMEETYQCYQLIKSLPPKFDSIVENIRRSKQVEGKVSTSVVNLDILGGNVAMELLLHHPVQLIEDTENIEQVQRYVDVHMCLHLLGLLCPVMSLNIVLLEVVEETETIHLWTKTT
ncbi:hypothetical protein TNCV_4961011 [Trichonephila clavipes]|uniref:Uncharacterized protein n=1 Tax=Trichonephila clavipes TaxID=2585209 RepID=A0A8X6SSQ6_TRICX|nr:hypothetical protein TNCV_4961011 [Trichonephila clavipes]